MDRQENIFELHSNLRDQMREVEMSLSDYLEECRDDPQCYASPAERMLRAIGEPEMIDTSRDPRPRLVSASRLSWKRSRSSF